jgi:hypothetical protein
MTDYYCNDKLLYGEEILFLPCRAAQSIDGQVGGAKWADIKHGTARSASARHGHDSYSASAGTARA